MEHAALSLPLPHLKDEHIFGTRENPAATKHQCTSPKHQPHDQERTKTQYDKRRKTMLAKRRYKVRVLAQTIPTTPTATAPVNSTTYFPTVTTASTQTPVVNPL